jgi:hypothetical protein
MTNLFQKFILISALFGLACLGNVAAQKPASGPVLFEFHSGFWINLHHFIYNQTLLLHPVKGASMRRLINKDTVDLNSLDETTRQQWLMAVDYYAKNVVTKDLLFDTGLVKIKNILEDKENELVLSGPAIPAALEMVLNGVAQNYRTVFWEKQNRNNQQWISLIQPLVEKYGDTLRRELQRLYLSHWPEEVIRVDVTNYASWSGAYTSLYPNRITISSTDSRNQESAALEIIFHEASHTLIDPISNRIDAICRRDNKSLPNATLWHAILFYTTGAVVKRHFPQYMPYGDENGLWTRAWPMYIDYLKKDWQPYLTGEVPFDHAIETLVRDVEVSK